MVNNKYLTNEQLSKLYRKEAEFFDNGGKSYEIITQRIKECKLSFYDHYIKKGKLVGLEITGKIKGIGKSTLESLERILEVKIEKPKNPFEKKSKETIENKNQGILINLGKNWKTSYKK